MTKERLLDVALAMRRLEESNTLQIKYEKFDSIYGMVYRGNNDNYLLVVNKNITYEKQMETVWHEIKHIESHLMKYGDVEVFERDAIEFSKYAAKYSEDILPVCRSAW